MSAADMNGLQFHFPVRRDVLFAHGRETPVEVPWGEADGGVAAQREVWGYQRVFTLGGEETAATRQASDWGLELEATVYAAENEGEDHARERLAYAPYPYLVEVSGTFASRSVFCVTLTDVFTFCNLLIPTVRLDIDNYRRQLAEQRERERRLPR